MIAKTIILFYAALRFFVRLMTVCNSRKTCFGICCAFFGYGIVHPFAVFSADNNAGIAQNLHMMRQCRLRNLKRLQKLAGTLFTSR